MCSLHEDLPVYEPTREDWAEFMAYLDDHNGWPDEPPLTPDSAYFDESDLAELFEPSSEDERFRLSQNLNGGA
jgi:hypothetical protein